MIIKIADNGCGMSQETQEKALRDYFTTKEYGSGIGLITVARTIEELNGTLKFSSTESVGTEFTIDLPCAFDF